MPVGQIPQELPSASKLRFTIREIDMLGGWIAISVLCLLLGVALYVLYEGWTAHSGGIELPDWGYALLGVGVLFGLVIGCGLMALAFYSSRYGYDEPTIVQPIGDGGGDDQRSN
jgi:hypothetical protein